MAPLSLGRALLQACAVWLICSGIVVWLVIDAAYGGRPRRRGRARGRRKRFRKAIVRILKRYAVHWATITAILYLLMIPLSIAVFPRTTILLTVIVLFGGFSASVASLSSLLVDVEQDEEIDELEQGR